MKKSRKSLQIFIILIAIINIILTTRILLININADENIASSIIVIILQIITIIVSVISLKSSTSKKVYLLNILSILILLICFFIPVDTDYTLPPSAGGFTAAVIPKLNKKNIYRITLSSYYK